VAHVLVRFTVEDFAKFKAVFEEAAQLRKTYGSKGVHVLRSVETPNAVIVFAEYEDAGRARQLFQSQEFRDATRRAGVVSPPDVTVLEEVGKLPA
jgi:heme-degrading monooxygenase HmoA